MSNKIKNAILIITISIKMRKERRLEDINTPMTSGHKDEKAILCI
jgi:hypothetical protein